MAEQERRVFEPRFACPFCMVDEAVVVSQRRNGPSAMAHMAHTSIAQLAGGRSSAQVRTKQG